jgi:hypothetical protein
MSLDPSLAQVDNTHGTMMFRSKFDPWRLDEAFAAGKWHPSEVAKAILSGNPFPVNVKNGPVLMEVWDGAVFWATNVPAQFREATKAMENRVLIVDNNRVVFDPVKPFGAAIEARNRGYSDPAALVIAEEKSGVLNWALDGADRIAKRGYYDLPDSIRRSMSDFAKDSNPVVNFFEECVEFDPESRVGVVDMHYAFVSFVRDDMRNNLPSANTMGKWIGAMGEHRIAIDGSRLRSGNKKFYGCVRLNDVGLDHWSSRSGELSARGEQRPGASDKSEDVNGRMPPEWGRYEEVERARAAIKNRSI